MMTRPAGAPRAAPEGDWPALYGALESRRKNEIAALLRIGLALAAAPDLPDLLQAVYQSLSGALDLTWFVAGLADEAAGQLAFPLWMEGGLSRPAPPVDLYRNNSLVTLSVRLRQPLTSVEAPSMFSSPHLAPGIALPLAYIVLPLMSQGRAMGALAAGSPRHTAYGDDELRLLNLVASMLSLAVEKARLYEAVARHARSLEERVVARTAELESEKIRFESTVQGLSEGLILFDLQEDVSFANERARSLLGLPLETLLGLNAQALWRQPALALDEPETVRREFAQALQDVESYPTLAVSVSGERQVTGDERRVTGGDTRHTTHDTRHTARDLSLRLFPVRDGGGKLLGRGLILQDITREREMDRMKDELVNMVSHELRTPLASVLGFAELLLTRDFPEAKRRQLIETIHKEAERLSALINDFLDLRRLEVGRQPLAFGDVCLAEVVQSVAAGFALTQPEHTLLLDVPPDLPPVRADPDRLGQAVRNLLANAFKYSPRGGRVTVTARAYADGDEARLTVGDEGLGLPAEVIPRLFQRFYRVDSSDRRQIGGTGLGLAIVKEIVNAHSGRVWAESRGPGQGSTFGFTLRLAVPRNGRRPLRGDEASAGVDGRPTAPAEPYILVVEDDPGAASLFREHLESAGMRVVVAAQPEVALDLVRQRAPLGVALDVCLPDPHQGWRLLSSLREVYPLNRLPIVVTSVLDERDKGMALGATGFLTKPFDPRRLVALLARPAAEVLVVDDETMILELTRSILQKSGYRVRIAPGGRAALENLAASLPDVMILDLMMPGMDGFEVLERLRALPGGRELPVVVVTAKMLDRSDLDHLHRYGAFLLAKGDYTAVRLRAAIEQALREKRADYGEGVPL
ncbi:MAG: response regulator [Chloroflexi bacterium]|nr:response regulator [Chloroflexota bacterium]